MPTEFTTTWLAEMSRQMGELQDLAEVIIRPVLIHGVACYTASWPDEGPELEPVSIFLTTEASTRP